VTWNKNNLWVIKDSRVRSILRHKIEQEERNKELIKKINEEKSIRKKKKRTK